MWLAGERGLLLSHMARESVGSFPVFLADSMGMYTVGFQAGICESAKTEKFKREKWWDES